MMNWITKKFKDLTIDELYDLMKLRVDVFVVEQTCYYPELDDADRLEEAVHILGYEDGKLGAYLRCLPKGSTYEDYCSIGRVVIAEDFRGRSLGHDIMKLGNAYCEEQWPGLSIKISAQEHLQGFYGRHGFVACTEPYLEDGIPHIGMMFKKDQ